MLCKYGSLNLKMCSSNYFQYYLLKIRKYTGVRLLQCGSKVCSIFIQNKSLMSLNESFDELNFYDRSNILNLKRINICVSWKVQAFYFHLKDPEKKEMTGKTSWMLVVRGSPYLQTLLLNCIEFTIHLKWYVMNNIIFHSPFQGLPSA